MKNKLIAAILFINLLFGQVAINLFHTEHRWKKSNSNGEISVLTKHADHCKVCALDFLHGLVFYEAVSFEFHPVEKSYAFVSIIEGQGLSVSFGQSRAPPVI